jgi:hypothetical protein
MLLHTLQIYEKRAKQLRETRSSAALPKVLMVVTGKGPLRYAYMENVAKVEKEEQWEFVRCVSLWLEAADYPLLLGESVSITKERTLTRDRELRSWYFLTFEYVRAGPTDEDRGHVRVSFARLCSKFCLVSARVTSTA